MSLVQKFERDIGLKRDMETHTKLNPQNRFARLQEFLNRIREEPECRDEFLNWNMKFSSNVVEISARRLQSVKIFFNNVRIFTIKSLFSIFKLL
jgi:hypothetical protein